jgi:hypothetical protein
MPLTQREFVQIVKQHASDGIGEETLKSAQKSYPFETDPDRSGRIRDFIKNLSASDRQTLALLLQDTGERAVGDFFSVLDGVGGSYSGTFRIYAVEDDAQTLIHPNNDERLQDIYSALCADNKT